MDENDQHQNRNYQLTSLASARCELLAIHLRAMKQLGAARLALELASAAGFDTAIARHIGDGGAPLTVVNLVDLVKQLELEEAHARELLTRVDARLAETSPLASAAVH